jgi:N-acetylglucosaminyl-diphospho-decaprenol L-rhamnosyltransferase
MITVGIVYHRDSEAPPFESGDSVTVVSHVNASSDGHTPWRGFGENHNALIEDAAGSDWYVALNPDVVANREDIIRLVNFAEMRDYAIAGPAIRTPWGMLDSPSHDLPTPRTWLRHAVGGVRRADRGAHARADSERIADSAAWITGACMAINLKKPVARFDERYFMYFEDVDICHRAVQSGGTIGFCSDVVVDHASGWSARDSLRWRRGVEFARSALRFAETLDSSALLMRSAGLARFASRIPLPGRTESELVAARCISRGFLNTSGPGLVELARNWQVAREIRA